MSYQFGEIVLLRFPFSNTGRSKKRPALVLFDPGDNDVVVCKITSIPYTTTYDVSISNWQEVGLLSLSTIRVHKIATLEKTLIEKRLGILDDSLKNQVQGIFIDFV